MSEPPNSSKALESGLTTKVVKPAIVRARHPSDRRSGSGGSGFGAHAESAPLGAGRARLGGDIGRAGRPGSPESQLPLERAGGARAGAAGPRTQMGRADRTAARGDGRFLRRLAGCPGSGRRGPASGDRQAVRELPHCGWPRVVREVGNLVRRAKETGKRLATLAVDTEIRFRSAADRAAFSNELAEAITRLVSKYHDESAPGGRAHRLVVVAHPLPQKPNPKEPS